MRKTWKMPAAALALAATAALAVSGCAPKKKDEPNAAEQTWTNARSGVTLSLAQDQYKGGNFDKARQSVEEALRLTPDSAPLRVLSAKLAIEQGQLERADKDLEIARKAAPNDAEAYYLSGVVCQRWQKGQAAYDYYKIATDKAPTELQYLMAQSEMLVGMDRSDEALALLQARVVYFEHSGGIRDAVARLMMAKGRHKEAVELFRQATILTPDEKSFREGLGMALYYSKQHKAAVEVLAQLVAIEEYAERADLRIALGESLLQAGKPRDARDNLEIAARLQPSNAGVWLGLARAALETGDLKRAELGIRKSIALNGKSPEAHLMLGYRRLRL